MPRNHRDLDLQEKRDALVGIARRLVLADGFEATGMARIASEAGVAPNTLYWYFEDKDALLIAILDSLVAEALGEYAKVQTKPLDVQLSWIIARFEGLTGLISSVHSRLSASPSVRDWHDRFHQMVESTLAARLAEHGVPETETATAARVAMFVIEGLLSHHAGQRRERDQIVQFVTGLVTRRDGTAETQLKRKPTSDGRARR
jgi:AcrR family transcriptional regulator